MKEWQQGYELDFLKQLAAPFKEEFAPYCFGAFGLPKERDIAAALRADQFAFSRAADGEITACALFSIPKVRVEHEDFARRPFKVLPGHLYIKAIVGWSKRPEKALYLIRALQLKTRATRTWVEQHEENQAAKAALSSAGFEWFASKISASSDIKGCYTSNVSHAAGLLPAPMEASDVPGIAILKQQVFSAPQMETIKRELAAYEERKPWQQHYSSYNKRKSWTAFALRGYQAADPGFIEKPAEMPRSWRESHPEMLGRPVQWTTAAAHFAATRELLRAIPGEKQRVRFMGLAAGGGELTRHADITDPEAGTSDGMVARLHIPIETEPGCIFRSWTMRGEERRQNFPQGSLCYLDTRKPHAVINGSSKRRVHLVVDVRSSPELRRMIAL